MLKKDYYLKNRNVAIARANASSRRRRYGLTDEDVIALVLRQGGGCAICGVPFGETKGTTPHVDHDHVSGAVRGLLCLRCNAGLGQLRDDTKILRKAIDYLEWED